MSEFHYDLEAGALCLDFANTAEWHASDRPLERLNNSLDLEAWAMQAGVLDETLAGGVQAWTEQSPDAAAATFERALLLREVIYRIFSAIALEQPVDPDDLEELNARVTQAMAQARIEAVAGGFAWSWVEDAPGLEMVLWAVARSAAELMTSDQLDRLRRCADDRGCGYLFIDTSRNRSRRWCSMKSCGNRAKAKRHYVKQTAEGG